MVEPTTFKQGQIIKNNNKSYILSEFNFEGNNKIKVVSLILINVSCKHCGGNLKKGGRIKNQYVCRECAAPNYINKEGRRLQ